MTDTPSPSQPDRAQNRAHEPVLLAEIMAALAPVSGGVFVDGTFGAGGYSQALLAAGAARVVAIDRDPAAIAGGLAMAAESASRLILVEGRFGDLDRYASAAGAAPADGVVLDLGVSSMQLDAPGRGFSFRHDGPLDMRMGGDGPTAADVVNGTEPRRLARILRVLGDEKRAGAIARAIAERRKSGALTTTFDLVAVVEKVLGPHRGDIHPATRTFQALRLYVNRELEELAAALGAAERLLAAGGRLVVVAFQSLEDRIVKRFFADRSRTVPTASRHVPAEPVPAATFTRLGRPVTPSAAEVVRNARARSARLRAGVRTAARARAIDLAALGVPALPALAGA